MSHLRKFPIMTTCVSLMLRGRLPTGPVRKEKNEHA
jgi:hypothetical protein